MSDERELIKGLFFKEPNMNAPDFVKMNGSIKIEDLGKFLREKFKNGDEWINFQVNLSKDGEKIYAITDNWKPEKKEETPEIEETITDNEDDLPF
jgi:putative sterol carrier protein